ncbi:MAG: DUF3857 domain-containing protein [Crocinitomix sp.]|nr:DUF3857 domain-containing protein [Crocinitomix sp.]
MKNTILLIGCFLLSLSASAANKEAEDTSFWRNKAELIEFSEADVSYGDATIFEDNRFINYKMRTREITRHKILYIKTQEGLDDNNKVIVYVPNEGTITNIKARSISQTGEVIELNSKNIKEIEDYSENGNLKVFAIEGAEVGGQIEYTYTLRTPLYDSGKEMLSMDYKTQHACIIIRCFNMFKIDSKAFNWDNSRTYGLTENKYIFNKIQPISDEKYATPYANRVAVQHKLVGSSYHKTTYSSYRNVLNKMRGDFFTFLPKEERKANSVLKSFTGESGDKSETIRKLTVYLKANFFYEEKYNNPDYDDVTAIMKAKVANDVGMTKLYCLFLKQLGIKYEVLMSCNKYDGRLDPDYCSRHTLDEFILHFPDYSTYLYPASQVTQYGLAPSWLAGNQALVITQSGYSPRFQEIESAKYDENVTGLTIQVDLDLDNNSSEFNIDAYSLGALSFNHNYDMYYADSEKEKQQELEGYVSWRYPDAEIVNVEMVDPAAWGDIGACKDYACRREFKATVKSASFFDKVGNKLLINVGTLLGPQTEMYSELERVQPITTAYNKSYAFRIDIPIPDGYKYTGEQNGIIDNSFKNASGVDAAGFKSTIEVVDNVIHIEIDEFYAFVNVEKEYYEDYRRVINSAADFNKAILLLEKK